MPLITPGAHGFGHSAVGLKGSVLKSAVRVRSNVENSPETAVLGVKGEDGEVAGDAIDETGNPVSNARHRRVNSFGLQYTANAQKIAGVKSIFL